MAAPQPVEKVCREADFFDRLGGFLNDYSVLLTCPTAMMNCMTSRGGSLA